MRFIASPIVYYSNNRILNSDLSRPQLWNRFMVKGRGRGIHRIYMK